MKARTFVSCSIVALLFGACTSPVSNHTEPAIIKGKVFDVFLEDTLSIMPNALFIDGQRVRINENLEFYADLLPGEYPVRVESENHFVLDTVVTISETDSLLLLELEPRLIDYFATNIGDEWKFDFWYISSHFPGERVIDYFNGEMTWTIVSDSISVETDDTVFTVSQILKGESFTISFGDTVNKRMGEQILSFEIIVEPGNYIRYSNIPYFYTGYTGEGVGLSIIGNDGSPNKYISFRDRKRITRYLPRSRTKGNEVEVVDFISIGTSHHLRPGIGFIQHTRHHVGNRGGGFNSVFKSFTGN